MINRNRQLVNHIIYIVIKRKYIKVYSPDAQKWSDNIPFIKTLAISAIVVALVVTPIPGDEYVAWAYFLRAIA
ncbi:hypothetical protein T479_15485 [Lysinibacillus varians]|nr:hypothetical protein T479_15485 [Lysinibacillus varians]